MKKTFIQGYSRLFLLCLSLLLWVGSPNQNLYAQCPGGPDIVSGVSLTTDGCGTVPPGITSITIETRGADGGSNSSSTNNGGSGATITGTFPVSPGDELVYLIGISPPDVTGSNGGGGGTAVINRTTGELLVVAAGGGGAAFSSIGGGARANTNSVAGGGTGLDAGGGGGFNNDGTTSGSSGAGQQFTIASVSSSTGGAGAFGIGPGGAGAGSGGGGYDLSNHGGGGGGGHLGGNSGELPSTIAQGGDSFVNTGIGGTVGGAMAGGNGTANNVGGHVVFTFAPPASIPTLSEWGLLILALLLMTFGTLYLVNIQEQGVDFASNKNQ
ncbi:MAG: IPTL-CTERM sorting domain-containing protein [Chitinophagales bacterium]